MSSPAGAPVPPPPDDVPVEDWALTRLLVTASRLVEHDIATQLRPHGLTHAGFGVLALVHGTPMSQRQLATACRVEEQTISRTVDRLERLGMVSRERDPADRRKYLVTITPDGLRVFRRATRHDLAANTLADLPEMAALRTALAALIRRLGGEDFVSLDEPGQVGQHESRRAE